MAQVIDGNPVGVHPAQQRHAPVLPQRITVERHAAGGLPPATITRLCGPAYCKATDTARSSSIISCRARSPWFSSEARSTRPGIHHQDVPVLLPLEGFDGGGNHFRQSGARHAARLELVAEGEGVGAEKPEQARRTAAERRLEIGRRAQEQVAFVRRVEREVSFVAPPSPAWAGRKSPPPPPRMTSSIVGPRSCAASGFAVAAVRRVGVERRRGGVRQAARGHQARRAVRRPRRIPGGCDPLPGGVGGERAVVDLRPAGQRAGGGGGVGHGEIGGRVLRSAVCGSDRWPAGGPRRRRRAGRRSVCS